MVGDLRGWPNHLGDDEPAIDVTLVLARAFGQQVSNEYLYRQSRMYFPRTQEDLMDYDVLFFNHPRLDFFTPSQSKYKVSVFLPLHILKPPAGQRRQERTPLDYDFSFQSPPEPPRCRGHREIGPLDTAARRLVWKEVNLTCFSEGTWAGSAAP